MNFLGARGTLPTINNVLNFSIIDETGMRKALGQSALTLDNIYEVTREMASSPTESLIKCYLLAPNRIEHDFSDGPLRLVCTIEFENNSTSQKIDLKMDFRQTLTADAGLNNNISFAWIGYSEKNISIVSITVEW